MHGGDLTDQENTYAECFGDLQALNQYYATKLQSIDTIYYTFLIIL